MTAVLPAAPAPAPPRGRLATSAWVLWRQYRAATLGVLGMLGFAAIILLITGLPMHAAYRDLGLDRCAVPPDARCNDLAEAFSAQYNKWPQLFPQLLLFVPALVGAFVGGPLLAREYESGTFRFAWTQGTSRIRWTLTRLLVLGLGLTLIAQAFSFLYSWWYAPWAALRGRFDAGGVFEVVGTVFAARTLFAFALGAFFGVLLRRTIPAMAATLAAWLAVVVPTITGLRAHYMHPLLIALNAPTERSATPTSFGGWILSTWTTDPAGHVLSQQTLNRLTQDLTDRGIPGSTYLAEHGYTTWQSYHPASRFWPFQLIETSCLAALSLLLAATTLYLVKRR